MKVHCLARLADGPIAPVSLLGDMLETGTLCFLCILDEQIHKQLC